MKEIKNIIDSIADVVSLSALSKSYFKKDKSWFYHKLNEDIVNNVQYRFNDDELGVLIDGLKDITQRLTNASSELQKIKRKRERGKGKYYTKANPFSHSLFLKWFNLIPKDAKFTEPFAGRCDIPNLINSMGINNEWLCYDIEPLNSSNEIYKVVRRDTLKNFPKCKVVVTNPPYLAKNSATRRCIEYPNTDFDDLYKYCLSLMLQNADYVAAIIPESFLTANIFQDRLFGVVSLNDRIFANTFCPVCLALFTQDRTTTDFPIYVGNKCLGTYMELEKHNLNLFDSDVTNWKFNAVNGTIAVKCTDSRKADICFMKGDELNTSIKQSSRSYTKIAGLPNKVNVLHFIEECNKELQQYRVNTKDIFLTSFKGLRTDNIYRRRISFKIIRRIMNKVLIEKWGYRQT